MSKVLDLLCQIMEDRSIVDHMEAKQDFGSTEFENFPHTGKRVLHLQTDFCTRPLKQSIIEQINGHDIYSASFTKVPLPTATKHKRLEIGGDIEENLYEFIEENEITHVHTHNWPDSFGIIACDIRDEVGGFKVIHDFHDPTSLNMRNYSFLTKQGLMKDALMEERDIMNRADSIVFPCQKLLQYYRDTYSLKKNNLYYIPSAVPYYFFKRPKINHRLKPRIAMVGNITEQSYRNLDDQIEELTKKYPLDIYWYHKPTIKIKKVRYKGFYPYFDLLKRLNKYDLIYCGVNTRSDLRFKNSVREPNKFYDAVAVGVPVIHSGSDDDNLKHLSEKIKFGWGYKNIPRMKEINKVKRSVSDRISPCLDRYWKEFRSIYL